MLMKTIDMDLFKERRQEIIENALGCLDINIHKEEIPDKGSKMTLYWDKDNVVGVIFDDILVAEIDTKTEVTPCR